MPKCYRPPKPRVPKKSSKENVNYSREDIRERIENEPALDDPKKRAELMEFIMQLSLS